MISLKNVSKWYGGFKVLSGCTTEVKKGDVVVVCGPSGSGKSTLIKCVNGLERTWKPPYHLLTFLSEIIGPYLMITVRSCRCLTRTDRP